MKRFTPFLALLAAFAAPSARAILLTTWQFPVNAAAIESEITNQVAVLSARRTLEGLFVLYRSEDASSTASSADGTAAAASGSTLAAGFVDGATLAGFSLVRSASAGRSAAAYNFAASDQASNYADAGETTWGAGTGHGSGWGDWFKAGDNLPTRTIQDDQFKAGGAGGDGGYGRSFENGAQLDAGRFTVSAEHSFTDAFSGFAVYAASDGGYAELLRWGVTTDRDADGNSFTGFATALRGDGQNNYTFFGDSLKNESTPISVQYELTWEAIEGGLSFQVTALFGETSYTSDALELSGVSAVSGVGVLVAGNSSEKYILFDDVSVEGHVIPEPATAGLVLLGAAALAAFRRRKRTP